MQTEILLLALLVACMFGVSSVLKKIILNNTAINSFTVATYEAFIHTIFGASLVLVSGVALFQNQQIIMILVIAGIIYALSLYLYNYAIENDEVSRATQLSSLEVIITPLFAVLLLGEQFSSNEFVGVALVIIGVLTLTIDRNVIDTTVYSVIPIGIALMIWGIEDVLLKYSLTFESIIVVYFWVRSMSFVTLFFITVTVKQFRTNTIEFITRKTINYNKSLALFPVLTSISLLLGITVYAHINLSLASPIIGSYPIFTLLFLYIVQQQTSLIKQHDEEPITKRVLSVLLFISGILVIYLF